MYIHSELFSCEIVYFFYVRSKEKYFMTFSITNAFFIPCGVKNSLVKNKIK